GAVSAAELRQAWERWELLLHCQPQVDLRAGSIAGVEELLGFLGRWRNPIMNANDTPTISCCECCKEISLDAALTPEGTEYVVHFCGLECYQRFISRADKRAASEPDHPCTPEVSTRHDD
ncbi:DUF3330 domain-containing protein, partial [Pseudomonas sp. NBRC 111142]